jgi:DNA-binding response OmpR family regulator
MAQEILVVETDPARAAQLAMPLEEAGFAVTRVGSFDEAVALLPTTGALALVTAVRLGAFNGLHLILRARAERPHILGCVTSASPEPSVQSDAASFGAQHLVAPWDDPAAFVQRVSRLLSTEAV